MMRRPRFRFSVRGMMVVVAILAAILFAVIMRSRSLQYRALSQDHARRADVLGRAIVDRSLHFNNPGTEEAEARIRADLRRWEDFHRLMHQKYRRAAGSPWSPVEPDPPEPE